MSEIYKISLVIGSIVAMIPFAIGIYQDAKRNIDEMNNRRQQMHKHHKQQSEKSPQ